MRPRSIPASSAVRPEASRATSAAAPPRRASRPATSSAPRSTAMCSGVRPHASVHNGSAPFCSSASAAATWCAAATQCSSVPPPARAALQRARASASTRSSFAAASRAERCARDLNLLGSSSPSATVSIASTEASSSHVLQSPPAGVIIASGGGKARVFRSAPDAHSTSTASAAPRNAAARACAASAAMPARGAATSTRATNCRSTYFLVMNASFASSGDVGFGLRMAETDERGLVTASRAADDTMPSALSSASESPPSADHVQSSSSRSADARRASKISFTRALPVTAKSAITLGSQARTSSVVLRTLLRHTPSRRCTPLHSIHNNTPRFIDAQSGRSAPQSTHLALPAAHVNNLSRVDSLPSLPPLLLQA
mmetsp:Transcript_7798/g.31679  ORF Transcript_7798/g.31679 Transcript_7798/m.31679 type:complete len:372 (+) Transcript_7798:96-1211(+)